MQSGNEALQRGITRRYLLRAGLVGVCACFLPWPALAKKPEAKAATKTPAAPAAPATNFYLENRDKLLADFRGVCGGAQHWLAARTAEPTAKAITDDAARRYEGLLPKMPDIGGPTNRNQPFLVMAGWLTALYQSMAEKGLAAKDTGRLFYDLYAADWAAVPPQKAKAMGAALFSVAYQQSLADWAAESQKKKYPGDWVGKAIPGDGKTFDLGYDYTECGAVKFFKAQGAMAVAPYYCLNDFLASRAQGTGLARKFTLAQGDPLCDFRYKRDRPVTQNWDTETPKFPGNKPA
ncbi:MAG: L-2-amino-thiazoline-4-carboxylic acid hydrolase [Solidesulfovibrio sp. DCME]|uniref:L-2-amino-thiazoline-4-carboxylic acid hydrolase n=1 Tax=Solidesulfovibrio sp. DCME TaxID=3447380 RepID=UPI003D0A1E3D